MKRSEMIQIVLNEFPKWNDNIVLDEYDVNGILNIIENAGMSPPTNKEKSFIMLENGEMTYEVNEWDEE